MNSRKTIAHLAIYLSVYLSMALLACRLFAAPPKGGEPHTAPRPSPVGQTYQAVGVTGITVTYGRPAVRGREIWGQLVPWGQIWRAGANDATQIVLTEDVLVEGEPLAAGTYGLFTLPAPDGWTVIFNRDAEQWGAFTYEESKDVLRVRVQAEKAPFVEALTFDFPEIGPEETVLRLRWARLAVPIKIKVPKGPPEQLLNLARRAAATEPETSFHLWEWINHLMKRGIMEPEMVEWASRIAASRPSFYSLQLKASVLHKSGRREDAIVVGTEALQVGEKNLGKSQFVSRQVLDQWAKVIEDWSNS